MAKCTGVNCPMQVGKVDPQNCSAVENCQWATKPLTNGDKLRAMTDEAMKGERESKGGWKMNVLVACEESQEVCKAFRERGHRTFSCDLQECSGGHPEWHIQGDCLPLLDGNCEFKTQDGWGHIQDGRWDLIIAHPPCTYLTNGGAVRLFRREKKDYPPYGVFQMVNIDRLKSGIEARDFFMKFLNADCKRIAIENPVPMSIYLLPAATQIIQPYMFGDPYSKKTCLWLNGLAPLKPTNIVEDYHPFINGGGGRLQRKNYKGQKFSNGGKARSKTFPGIAAAMAEQWGNEEEEGETK